MFLVLASFNSSNVLIVGLAFRVSIPFRKTYAGVQETSHLGNGRKLRTPQLIHVEMSTRSLFRKVKSRGNSIQEPLCRGGGVMYSPSSLPCLSFYQPE
jgi:hypothetical protein